MKSRCKRSIIAKTLLSTCVLCACALTVTPALAKNTYPQTLLIEPDQGLNPIYDLVSSAKSRIDMTMYELQDTTMQNLLCQAAANGVKVHVILDVNNEQSNNTAAYNQLQGCGVDVVWAWTKYESTHQKTITVDKTTTAIMSLNLTSRYYSDTRDFAVIESDPSDISAIEATFSRDFNHEGIKPPIGDNDLVWSPTNSQAALLKIINGAKHSLLIENEEMSDSTIVSALESAAERGVSVTICMNDDSSYTSEFNALTAAGVKLSTYVPDNPIYIHAKAIVADYGTSTARAFVGSENFSNASLTNNRELGLVTTNASVMNQLETTMSNDFAGATPWQ
jgi:phosphatidylserine/phosphatidylglycerophosphate/cardiolipin synthase-like enzyme